MKYLETNDSLRSKILIILHSRFDPTQGSADCPGLETDQSELSNFDWSWSGPALDFANFSHLNYELFRRNFSIDFLIDFSIHDPLLVHF